MIWRGYPSLLINTSAHQNLAFIQAYFIKFPKKVNAFFQLLPESQSIAILSKTYMPLRIEIKKPLFLALSEENQALIFDNLPMSVKAELLETLSDKEKSQLLALMTYGGLYTLIDSSTSASQIVIYKLISQEKRIELSSLIENALQATLLLSLPLQEKVDLMSNFSADIQLNLISTSRHNTNLMCELITDVHQRMVLIKNPTINAEVTSALWSTFTEEQQSRLIEEETSLLEKTHMISHLLEQPSLTEGVVIIHTKWGKNALFESIPEQEKTSVFNALTPRAKYALLMAFSEQSRLNWMASQTPQELAAIVESQGDPLKMTELFYSLPENQQIPVFNELWYGNKARLLEGMSDIEDVSKFLTMITQDMSRVINLIEITHLKRLFLSLPADQRDMLFPLLMQPRVVRLLSKFSEEEIKAIFPALPTTHQAFIISNYAGHENELFALLTRDQQKPVLKALYPDAILCILNTLSDIDLTLEFMSEMSEDLLAMFISSKNKVERDMVHEGYRKTT